MTDHSAGYLPRPVDPKGFNSNAQLPYGLKLEHLHLAMNEFIDFLGFVNQQLATKDIQRLETLLMPANFSSIVGEFVIASVPKYCPILTKNRYHNGHPDLIPSNHFPEDRVQHSHEGIEVKASRYSRGWQGHNPENVWLMVLVFECNRANDAPAKQVIPFRFVTVAGASLEESDWKFAGRSITSRRTITASVAESGYRKMMANWLYKAPSEKSVG